MAPENQKLEHVADLLADASTQENNRQAVAAVVADAERWSQKELGTTDPDPLVVLIRRFARAHRHLVDRPLPTSAAEALDQHALALAQGLTVTSSTDEQQRAGVKLAA